MNETPRDYSHGDWYTTGHYGVTVVTEARKPVLYTADGKPLGKTPQRIGFAPPEKA